MLLSDTWIMPLIGEASLAIYLYQNVLVTFWFNFGVAGIISGQFPYTRAFVTGHNSYLLNSELFLVLAVVAAVLVCIFIQKIYQDRFISSLYIEYLKRCRGKTSQDFAIGCNI
jgi:peptidoglycan/LPS O-acetylase OafA/YrhL